MKRKHDLTKDELRNWLSDEDTTPEDREINQTEDALNAYANAHAIPPPDHLRSKILGKIGKLASQKQYRRPFDINNPPLLDENANWLDWEEAVKGIEPPEDFENIHLHSIESNEQRELFVIWVREFVEEEVHTDLLESFLILEGSCECHITDRKGDTRIVRLGQGDFITMQLEETHDIVITSAEPAKAILQWRKLAG